MHYSNIRSRAGLVALVFALIISFVSALPIPTTESGLSSTLPPRSNPSLNGQVDTAGSSLSGRMSMPLAVTRTLSRRQDISTDMDDRLVRRGVATASGAKIKHAFQIVKQGFKKAGSAIKKGFQKVGGVIKKGFQKAGAAKHRQPEHEDHQKPHTEAAAAEIRHQEGRRKEQLEREALKKARIKAAQDEIRHHWQESHGKEFGIKKAEIRHHCVMKMTPC